MQSTEKVCEHQNANYLAMMRERDDARAALAAERDRADRAEAALAEIREYADDASEDVPAAGIDSILDKWEATA